MDLDQLNRELAANHLAGFWTGNVTGFEQNIEPYSRVVPHLWKWSHIYDGLMKARELVNMQMAERRTIRLSNPKGDGWTTPTVRMSVRLVRPGEIAKAASALAHGSAVYCPRQRRVYDRRGRALCHVTG